MKVIVNSAVVLLLSVLMTACATHSHNDWVNDLPIGAYEVHSYQPPCYVTTTRHASGAVLGQFTECPPVQYYCTLTGTQERITCPKFNKKREEKYTALLDTIMQNHYQEDCRLVYEYNRTHNLGKSKSQWHKVSLENPYCNIYGEPK